MALMIPPNGFTGSAQQTAAVRNHINTALGHTKSVKRKRTKKAKASTTPRKKRAKSSSSTGLKILKAGSAAALAWGKKMAAAKRKKAKG